MTNENKKLLHGAPELSRLKDALLAKIYLQRMFLLHQTMTLANTAKAESATIVPVTTAFDEAKKMPEKTFTEKANEILLDLEKLQNAVIEYINKYDVRLKPSDIKKVTEMTHQIQEDFDPGTLRLFAVALVLMVDCQGETENIEQRLKTRKEIEKDLKKETIN